MRRSRGDGTRVHPAEILAGRVGICARIAGARIQYKRIRCVINRNSALGQDSEISQRGAHGGNGEFDLK